MPILLMRMHYRYLPLQWTSHLPTTCSKNSYHCTLCPPPPHALAWANQSQTIPKGMTLEEYDEMKRRKPVGKKNPEVTEETRKKISTRLKEKWKDPSYREQRKQCMPNRRGVPHSEETKARISAAVKEKWNDPAYREKVREMYWRRRGWGWGDGRGRARDRGVGGL